MKLQRPIIALLLILAGGSSYQAIRAQLTHSNSAPAINQTGHVAQALSPIKISFRESEEQGASLRVAGEKISLAAPTAQSDLQATLTVSYDKETRRFLIEGQVVNLGPAPSVAERRTVQLIAVKTIHHTKSPTVSVRGLLKKEVVPALPIVKPSASAGKFFSVYKISAVQENMTQHDDDPDYDQKTTYGFQIILAPGQSDPNTKNDRAEFAASNLNRAK